MSRAAFVVIVLAASPALAAPFNTFDGQALEVDAISGGNVPEETPAAPAAEPAPAATPAPATAPAIKYQTGSTGTREPAATTAATNTLVAVLEPPPAGGELRDAAPVTPVPRHLPKPTPRFDVAAGIFLQSRGQSFLYDTFSEEGPPSYEDGLQGFAVAASVYPLPIKKVDGRLSGLGFSVKLAKSLGGTIVASDETGTGEFDVQHTSYDAAVHYKHPIDKFAIEGEVAYGGWNHILVDLPESIAAPDTDYNYLALGGRVEAYPGERATLGATARYLHIPSSGDVTSEDWYGAGDAHAWQLGGDVTVNFGLGLFLRAGVDWRRVTLEFDGSGYLSYEWGVWQFEDTLITGTALFGAQF